MVMQKLSALAAAIAFAVLVSLFWVRDAGSQSNTESEEDEEILTDANCNKIPGGNAPANRLARLDSKLSVQNLELTYFEKPLFQLTAEDFELLRKLLPFCEDISTDIAKIKVDRVEALIVEAQDTRNKTLEWISERVSEIEAMEPTSKNVRRIHVIWDEMQARQYEMTRADLNHFAGIIEEKRLWLYDSLNKARSLPASPFDPGPPFPRTN